MYPPANVPVLGLIQTGANPGRGVAYKEMLVMSATL